MFRVGKILISVDTDYHKLHLMALITPEYLYENDFKEFGIF